MIWRAFRLLVSLALALVIGVTGVVGTYASRWVQDVPDYRELDSLTLGSTTRVYARDLTPVGTLVPSLAGGARINRTLVTLDQISPYVIAAVVTNEDRRFFQHYGVDPIGILRGSLRIARNERVEGGSTLTNQLVKNTLLQDLATARSVERKVKEWLLSVRVERTFTKEEILTDYLNVVYWGDGGPVELFGLHAAAQAYFGKSPRELDLAESTYLATLVPSPARYFNFRQHRAYMRSLLNRMVEDGWVTQAQADEAWRVNLQPNGWKVEYDEQGSVVQADLVDRTAKFLRPVATVRAPHFMQQVERQLIARFGRERVYGSGGLNVITTLDAKAQSAAEKASLNAKIPEGATLGMVLLDPHNGQVIAMVGQKLEPNKPPAEWNNAAQGQRQVGSSIKPLLYTTALSLGMDQLHTEDDKPISFPCESCPEGKYEPQNYGGKFLNRPVTLRESLNLSLNIPTLQLADRIGLSPFEAKLREMGLTPPRDGGLSLAIGTLEANPLQMATAYAAFVNGGMWKLPRYILRVETASGDILYDASYERQEQRRVWNPQVAYLGLDMLYGVVNDLGRGEGGLSWRARIPGWSVGGKTGTTNDVKDLWFVGVTPAYVGAVWVGKQAGGRMGDNDFSGVVNAPIWHEMVAGTLAGRPPQQFRVPEGVTFKPGPFKNDVAAIDPEYRPVGDAEYDALSRRPQYREVSGPPAEPGTVLVAVDRRTGRIATEFTPPEAVVTRRVRVSELPGYAPDPNPAPLEDELPETEATEPPAAQEPAGQDGDIPSAPSETTGARR